MYLLTLQSELLWYSITEFNLFIRINCIYFIHGQQILFRWQQITGQNIINAPECIKYKQNTAEHNSITDFIKVCSYIVSFNDMFQL